MSAQAYDELWRELTPQVLAAVVRRYGHFELAEEAVQEALLAASTQWPRDGLPNDPRAWLISVAARRTTDLLRSEGARRQREESVAVLAGSPPDVSGRDDTLTLLLLCCHPALSQASQVALTLRAVGGLSTREIGQAFLTPEATMAQRISRAKKKIRDAGTTFELPGREEMDERLDAVKRVIYLVFNEGYAVSSGEALQRGDLTREAIRLARLLHRARPMDGEAAGLLALLLLTDARRPARETEDGRLVPLDEQDRTRWDRAAIAEGVDLVTDALRRFPLGPYQVQAAIAAVHDESPTARETDWPQILALYDVLRVVQPGPVVELNRAVAVAMTDGPRAGLAALDAVEDDRVVEHHRFVAVRAHLLEMAGDPAGARTAYERAADLTTSIPEQRFLLDRAARSSGSGPSQG
ncbi:sigma-70 family RNA polymerase sigma factor [Luteipulveratus sp. YIM 133132]|uniref:RNA polymerase sigma factor n=1 Tax=Luteipulveratus flavus TaxID=3031728 RepID=UPI0023B1596B|nr:sigma-70 family RNA polymerase sigma factor [Luteipulveratus sp. YIM 133132]MDE9366702.1 sigma-70 family RNA polymerase sigma factor [Luteipulveratus sp. YIM 133132]